jgi:hypothetical protein
VSELLSVDDAEEYTQSLSQIGAGWWRQIALGFKLGVPDALGLERREWVEDRLGGYMRLSIPERREAVGELTEEGFSQPEIADTLGVAQSTVSSDIHADDEPIEIDSSEPEPASGPQVDESAHDEPIEIDSSEPEPEPVPEPEPEPEEPSEAVTEFLDSDQDLQNARYLHAFYKAITRSDDFMEFDPKRLAEIGDADVERTVDDYVSRVSSFADRFHLSRPGLRVVHGGNP